MLITAAGDEGLAKGDEMMLLPATEAALDPAKAVEEIGDDGLTAWLEPEAKLEIAVA